MRQLSITASDWWDYSTLDQEILDEATLKNIDNIVGAIIQTIKGGKSYVNTHELTLNNLIETVYGF